MTVDATSAYHEGVTKTVWRRAVILLLLAFALASSLRSRAQADPSQIPSSSAPVIYVRLGVGSVTVHTWDRAAVQVDGDPTIASEHIETQAIANRLPHQMMLWSQTIQTPADGALTLPAEPFPLPPLDTQPHDVVLVRGEGDVTLTVPTATALVVTSVRQGAITIEGYHGGTFAALMVGGTIHLDNVSGTGAVQLNNGPFFATNSNFDRLRVRTGRGSMYFDGCNSAQIQASSLLGSIVYDNGTFTPGLAHFESTRGDIALGVANNDARINAHSDSGKILTGREIQTNRTSNDAQASLSSEGPVVTATSGSGSVIFYRGSIREHPELQRQLPLRLQRSLPMRPRMRRPPFGAGRPPKSRMP